MAERDGKRCADLEWLPMEGRAERAGSPPSPPRRFCLASPRPSAGQGPGLAARRDAPSGERWRRRARCRRRHARCRRLRGRG